MSLLAFTLSFGTPPSETDSCNASRNYFQGGFKIQLIYLEAHFMKGCFAKHPLEMGGKFQDTFRQSSFGSTELLSVMTHIMQICGIFDIVNSL